MCVSIIVSALSLVTNFYRFYREARINGTDWTIYALSILQLSELPVPKFVPRLWAIKRGYVKKANYAGFAFDKASFGPLIGAINSSRCQLKTIKVSHLSLSRLDHENCRALGQLLKNAKLKVNVSSTYDGYHIYDLFRRLDKDHNGYLGQDHSFVVFCCNPFFPVLSNCRHT